MRRRRRQEESYGSLNLPKKRRHFFKIILKANIRDGRLRIPRKFVREFGKELSDVADLKVPSGKVWSIGLRKAEGKVWFQKGWEEFVKFHSLCEYHFLVFRYDGNSNFYVCIFDTTASEIEYPFDTEDCEEENPNGGCQIKEVKEEQDLEEIYCSPPRSTKTTANLRKAMIEAHKAEADRNGLRLKQEEKNMQVAPTNAHAEDSVAGSRPIMIQKRGQLLQGARAFKSKNPFCIIKMQPSYVSCSYLNVPGRFARRFMTQIPQRVALRGPDGRRWHVRCCLSKGGTCKVTKGWKMFVQENGLKEGDICIFELVKKSPIKLKVFIFRLTEDVRTHGALSGELVLQRARAFKSKNPFCIITMQPSYVSHKFNLNVPGCFARRFLTQSRQTVTLRGPDGKSWHVSFYLAQGGQIHKGWKNQARVQGWKVFAQENHLEEGDICIFELVKKSPIMLEVFIFRPTEDVRSHEALSRELVLQRARAFKSKNPFCIITMYPSYVSQKFYLNVPGSFARRFLTHTPQIVKLRGPDGKIWHVSFSLPRSGGQARIRKGWKVFAQENGLKEGDSCIFELVRKSSIELKVLIFRLTEDVPPHGS